MSCCTSTTRPTASTADPPGDPVWRMAPGLRKPRLRPASAVSSPGPPRRKPHLTRNVHGSHPSMHVFSLGRFCASPKPSPRGEDAELCSSDEVKRSRLPPAVPVSRRVPVPRHKPSPRGEDGELCSPDAMEASRPLRRRRSRAASCVISCFQSSMLLHNLSSEICRFRRIRVFHRLFHISAGFPQRLSFPLAFFERDRVRYAGSVGSSCSVGYATVLYGTVWYGAT